jgi:hypothetical protein
MNLAKLRGILGHRQAIGWGLAALAVAWLLLYKLGSLTGGLSRGEMTAAAVPVGWHGIYDAPLGLPLKIVRSVVFFLSADHGQTLSRLPNVVLGGLSILSFAVLIRLWHGARVAALATAMFAVGAWTLHVSRLASSDVMYLWAMPTLLASHFLLRKYYKHTLVWLGSIVVWGLLLYIPGMFWLVAADVLLQRRFVLGGWREAKLWWQRLLYVFAGLVWLPLLVLDLTRHGELVRWLGLPAHFDSVRLVLKHFVAVPVHLFIRGPEYPDLWLGRSPVLDIFALALCILGIYFYASRWKSSRSRYLLLVAVLGFLLVGVGGAVPLSLLVPLLYVAAATGLAYLLHEWLKTFPNNPLARGLGLSLVIFAVALSCVYNYRAYFIAWPHNATTRATFHYHRHR